jgi:hypothetical protein
MGIQNYQKFDIKCFDTTQFTILDGTIQSKETIV